MRARKFNYFNDVFLLLPKPVPKAFYIIGFHLKISQLIGIVYFAINRYSVFKIKTIYGKVQYSPVIVTDG